MSCEGGQIYPSSASGGELGAAFTGWRDCWRGCDFTSDDFYLFWLYAGAAVVSGRISAKQELLRGNRVQVVGTLVLCNLAVTAVTVVLYLIAVVIVAVFAVWFADRRLELILVLEARDRIEMVLMPLMSIALMSVNYGALTVLYVQLDRKRQNKERWKFEAGEHAGLPWMSRRNRMAALALLTALSAGAMYDAFTGAMCWRRIS